MKACRPIVIAGTSKWLRACYRPMCSRAFARIVGPQVQVRSQQLPLRSRKSNRTNHAINVPRSFTLRKRWHSASMRYATWSATFDGAASDQRATATDDPPARSKPWLKQDEQMGKLRRTQCRRQRRACCWISPSPKVTRRRRSTPTNGSMTTRDPTNLTILSYRRASQTTIRYVVG
jgi:hypothetical protein